MLSFTFTSAHLLVPSNSLDLTPHSCPCSVFEVNYKRGTKKKKQRFPTLRFVAGMEAGPLFGFLDAKGIIYRDCFWGCCGGFVRRCRKGWESEGDWALEAEILEFMKNSANPDAFPNKKQLMDAGRMDLVESILKQGGWLASGWDLDDSENVEERVLDNDEMDCNSTIRDEGYSNGSFQDKILEGIEIGRFEVPSLDENSHSSASSSGRSLETTAEDDSGIEGILNRLEKERNINFGIGLREKGNSVCIQSNDGELDRVAKTSNNVTVAGLKGEIKSASLNSNNRIINDSRGELVHSRSFSNFDGASSSLKSDMWRTWSIQRAGFSNMEFEAGEIASNDARTGGEVDALGGETLEKTEGTSAFFNGRKEYSCDGIGEDQLRSRLQHLESELSSVLHRLKSNTGESVSQKDNECSSDDMLELSDAMLELSDEREFQENEIMNAKDKLRSIRAKLAVLEGKMALAIIDTQKMVEEKQRRIDDARRASRLLRTACIVWPNSASEVLLAGSFDGWSTQRKMEKSSTGIFSLHLKLYPGRYEIKFIVDGEWRIDPLRPIVHNNGYENNLLVIA